MIICLKVDLAFNNIQRLICRKNQITNQHYTAKKEVYSATVFK